MDIGWRPVLLLFLTFCCVAANEGHGHHEENITSFHIVTWKWATVEAPYMIVIWLLVASLAKILFQICKPVTKYFPDSSLLIVVGLLLGFVLLQSGADVNFTLDSHTFFLYLLPPIIFDAGYFMPNRSFFENIDSIFLFAIIGTIWNTVAIGGSLLLLSHWEVFSMTFSTFEIFVFSALISAVDPVAVIAVFEEINVNEFLFVNVFGEALFNDGVTVVLYQMFKSFAVIGSENLTGVDYGAGALSFFVVALGGAAIGLIFALLVAYATKYTNNVRILAPLFIFLIPYMAYLTAEMSSLSSIIAIAVCGMAMKQYVKGNISQAAANSVKYFTKMLAGCTETVIFMFLGLSTIGSEHYWDTWFVVATVGFCLLYRTIGVIVQCFFLNKFRHKEFTKIDQFVLSYGGLRGAIAFGLAVSIPESIGAKPMFVTTTIVVIYFTVFLQGITIRPLVEYLNVETKDHRAPTMTESVYNKYLDYMMSGLEDIAGQQGAYSFRDNFERFNAKVLRPVLLRDEHKKEFDASSIVRAYAKITLEDAMSLTKQQKLEHKQVAKLRVEDEKYGEKTYTNQAFDKEISRDNQTTVTPRDKQLAKFMAAGENVDGLYALFSDLLDRKLKEMDTNRDEVEKEADDIQDDYMQQMSSAGSHANLRSGSISGGPDMFRRDSRRQSTGGMRDRRKSYHHGA